MISLFRVFVLVILGSSLVACNMPQPKPKETQQTLNQNELATQVQNMLATLPAEMPLPTQAAIQPQVTVPLPVSTLIPTETPTPVIQTSTSDAHAATATASPTIQTATPPATPTRRAATPLATSNAADPRTILGTPTRTDKFDDNSSWFPFSDSHTKVQIANGSLEITAINPDGWSSWTLTPPQLTNFYLEATTKPGACEGLDSYGPMLRAADATHGYLFAVSCDGQYRFVKVDGNQFSDLIQWTANPAILKGADQTNRLGVMAKGDQFTLFINGVQVDQVTDDAYGSGEFGLFISSYKTENFTVQVSEVDYWNQP